MKISGTVVFVAQDERSIVVKFVDGYALFRLRKRKRIPEPGDRVKVKWNEDSTGRMKRRKKKNAKVRFEGIWPTRTAPLMLAQQITGS